MENNIDNQKIKDNLITYFDNLNISKSDDFLDFTLSQEKTKLLIPEYNTKKDYISINKINTHVKTITDFNKLFIKEMFLQIKIKDRGDFNEYISFNNRKQILFTYSIQSLLTKFFPDLTIKIEDDFFKRECFKDLYRSFTRGPRVDIIIDKIQLIIEFDEQQHNSFEHTIHDKERDEFITGFGYSVCRYKLNDNIMIFMDKLKSLIIKRNFLFDSKKILSYIIDFFKNSNIDKKLIELLVKEQSDDIINGVSDDKIGMIPNNLTLNILTSYIGADEECIEEIKENLEELCADEYPYEETEDDIILSPKVFEYLLSKISSEDYAVIEELRKMNYEIKIIFINNLYKSHKEFLKTNNALSNAYTTILNNTYNRAKKDNFSESNKFKKKCENAERDTEFYRNMYIATLSHNGRGIIRKNLIAIKDKLIQNQSLISEIPELVYDKSKKAYVDINDIKRLYKINKLKYKIINSFDECINKINQCLSNEINSTSISSNLIYHCKIQF